MDATDLPQPAEWVRATMRRGVVIPAHPLALNASRRLDERRQRALTRYYHAAGAGGVAVGVHTTQFAIREPRHGLLRPVLELASETVQRLDRDTGRSTLRIAGICGPSSQAVAEAVLARELGYHAGLLSLGGALRDAAEAELMEHAWSVAREIPLVGFYLQPAAGGRILSHAFWRRFVEIPNVVAIKIAPFNRYQTLDVLRAVAESGREDLGLYTGNDDSIVADLITPWQVAAGSGMRELRIVGGLLGHWAVWTRRAVDLLGECHAAVAATGNAPHPGLLRLAGQVTEANAALFDVAHGFRGCIAGIHEVLRRQGLLEGVWCLDPSEGLSPGQARELDRICRSYPHLVDDEFVAEHRDQWLG
jgi:dihydrodipicolinate synthase/N-acetylneuraminate lyase